MTSSPPNPLLLAVIVRRRHPLADPEEGAQFYILKLRKLYALLEKSCQEFAAFYGISKAAAVKAVVRLEEQGLIKRVFKTFEPAVGGRPNVLIVELNRQRLQEPSRLPQTSSLAGEP